MFRFTLAQFLMAQCLIGILIMLWLADGSGEPLHAIRSLAFSPDGQRLAVARNDARRVLQLRLKAELDSVSRTISLLSVPTLEIERVLRQDSRRGNQGTAHDTYGHRGGSLTFVDDHYLAVAALPDEREDFPLNRCDVRTGEASPLPWQLRARAVGIRASPDQRLLAATNGGSLEFLPLQPDAQASVIPDLALEFPWGCVIQWSPTGERVSVATWPGEGGILQPRSGPQQNLGKVLGEDVYGLVFSAADEPILAAGGKLLLFDATAECWTCLWPQECYQLASAGDLLAFTTQGEPGVVLLDLAKRERRGTLRLRSGSTCLEFAPGGKLLAVGTAAGQVELWDTQTCARLALVNAPTQLRWPWFQPAGLCVVWGLVWWRMHLRREPTAASPTP